MSESWLDALSSIAVAMIALSVPGALVIVSGWRFRDLRLFALSPAISAALLAVAAVVAPWLGLTWSWLPVGLLTVLACVVAFVLGRWAPDAASPRPRPLTVALVLAAVAVATVIVGLQLRFVFISPDSISQTFDAIVHLNSVQYAIETENASAFSVGKTSDVPFYPNAWHSLASLTAVTTHVSVPVAVNASNMAIGALAWPVSTVAMASALFPRRASAVVIAAILSTGFGAFPILLYYFGVLYPNAMAYALLPAGIATIIWALSATSLAGRVRALVLLLVVTAGIALAHPNAMLALYAIGIALTILTFVRNWPARPRRTAITIRVGIVVLLLVGAAGIWAYARTPYAMSRWGAWQSPAQAAGEAILGSPRGYPVTLLVAFLIILGLLRFIRQPARWSTVIVPFVVVAFFFVLVSGFTSGNLLREAFTNPWYNDPYRLAALLPMAVIPIATLGALVVVDAATALFTRFPGRGVLRTVATAVALIALLTVAIGPNVTSTAEQARGAYAMNATSALLTDAEVRLLSRLDDEVPDDALIIGSPWTGASLAYALTGREVTEKHIFGTRTADELYLDQNLAAIDSDSKVCEAVEALGVDYVLDFGSQNVFSDPAAAASWDGIQSIPPSAHLVVVDAEGPDARLLRIEGCGGS
ncbi:DUF6541 family protein [Microbacterium sp. cx-59]|uniref:DUF6541 family protein n=1 Tax=Microbacterium sp. cx-59 TaxID=2891207 RepID=UPI001E48C1C8|nr:DUF6541 family protein [Microbacterium sp. cx-59]MCC4907840.1 hypothetical protein [Microbacterium sp. cx-59]